MVSKKIITSTLLAITSVLLSLPVTYSLSDRITKSFSVRTTFDNCPGLPTVVGSILHGFVFMILAYIIIIYKNVDSDSRGVIKIEKIITPPEEVTSQEDEQPSI